MFSCLCIVHTINFLWLLIIIIMRANVRPIDKKPGCFYFIFWSVWEVVNFFYCTWVCVIAVFIFGSCITSQHVLNFFYYTLMIGFRCLFQYWNFLNGGGNYQRNNSLYLSYQRLLWVWATCMMHWKRWRGWLMKANSNGLEVPRGIWQTTLTYLSQSRGKSQTIIPMNLSANMPS